MPTDTLGCHSCVRGAVTGTPLVENGDATKHPTMYSGAPTT